MSAPGWAVAPSFPASPFAPMFWLPSGSVVRAWVLLLAAVSEVDPGRATRQPARLLGHPG